MKAAAKRNGTYNSNNGGGDNMSDSDNSDTDNRPQSALSRFYKKK